MQSNICRHDSSLVTYSSSDAVSIDPVYGAGKFTCIMNNVNRGATHAIKVVPTRVMVPNVFPNLDGQSGVINVYTEQEVQSEIVVGLNNTFDANLLYNVQTAFGGVFTGDERTSLLNQPVVFPVGSYTPNEFVTKFNELYQANKRQNDPTVPNVQMSVVNNEFVITVTNMLDSVPGGGTGSIFVGVEINGLDVLSQLGFPTDVKGYEATVVRDFVTGYGTTNGPTPTDTTAGFVNPFSVTTPIPSSPTLTVKVNDFSIPSGFYDIQSLVSTMSDASEGQFEFSYDDNTRKVSIEILEQLPGQPKPITIGLNDTTRKILGIHNNDTVFDGNTNEYLYVIGTQVGDTLTARDFPSLGTTPLVHVVAKQLAMNNMVANNSLEYDVLATIPMHEAQYGQYASYTSPDIFVDDIDFRTARSLTKIDFEIVDHKYNIVKIDPRFPVIIQLKVYHIDTVKG